MSRAELRDHLVHSRIAGEVATPRGTNLGNYARCSAREPLYTFGLEYGDEWTAAVILSLMAATVGVSPDEAFTEGIDTIAPDCTLDALDRMSTRIRQAVERRERVLLATGHPGALLAIHAEIARALAAAGCELLAPAGGRDVDVDDGSRSSIVHLIGVAMVSSGAALKHTHSPGPMVAMLRDLAARGEAPPDLVIADHGYAGAAGQAGVDAIGFADCNDPAMFVGEALGKVLVAVPLDDGVLPELYAPLTAYLLRDLDLATSTGSAGSIPGPSTQT